MLAGLLAAVVAIQAPGPPSPMVERDGYGVPTVRQTSVDGAFLAMGYAVAQDRLWQMENSRRTARGRMAEVFGPNFADADREVMRGGYTDEELQKEIEALSPMAQMALSQYAAGVNLWIQEARREGKLPPGYAENGFLPEPWTPLDSAAITIRLFNLFGRFGAGELRNLALLTYLEGRAETKARAFDVLDDFAWFNDPEHLPTLVPSDVPNPRNRPDVFVRPTRGQSEAHLRRLPRPALLELLPGVRIAEGETVRRVAEARNTPFKAGSYAVVVGPSRSANGVPLLLGAPQMGHATPSIVHPIAVDAPGYQAEGMNVPGVPGVAIGTTPFLAWTLTSGVGDTDDIYAFAKDGEDGYLFGKERRKLDVIERPLRIKGRPAETVRVRRTVYGPVILETKSTQTLFVRRSASWGRELESLDTMLSVAVARSTGDIDRALAGATAQFNAFYATREGDIGFAYVGLVPVRPEGIDPRLPLPGDPAFDWRGFLPFSQMPQVRNPRSGLLSNWNNKPVSWWPHGDTPAWGAVFRNSVLAEQVRKPQLSSQDLEFAAWSIARRSHTWEFFRPYVAAALPRLLADDNDGVRRFARDLASYSGDDLLGSRGAAAYAAFFPLLRQELFLATTGNFFSNDNFNLVAQPTVMLQALRRRTRVDYLGSRSPEEVVAAALRKAAARAADEPSKGINFWFNPGGMRYGKEPVVPYGERGTYIQVVEVGSPVTGRNVTAPGAAEAGAHAFDQVPLARAWTYRPMRGWPSP